MLPCLADDDCMVVVSNVVNNTIIIIGNVIVDLGILAFWARIDFRIMTFLWNTIEWWGVADVDFIDDVVIEEDDDDDELVVAVDDNFIVMMIFLIEVIGSNGERPVVTIELNDDDDNNRSCWDDEILVAVVLLYESNDKSHFTSLWMANLFDNSWFGWIFVVVVDDDDDDDSALWSSNEHVSSYSIGSFTLSILFRSTSAVIMMMFCFGWNQRIQKKMEKKIRQMVTGEKAMKNFIEI